MSRLYQNIDVLDNVGNKIYLNRYDGGLNTTSSNEILLNNEAIIRKNWDTDNVGAIVKVNGFTKMNETTMGAKPVRGLFRAEQSDGTKKLIVLCNGKCFYSDDDGATFTQEGNSTAYTETDFFTGVNYNNNLFFTGATQNLHVYNIGLDTSAAATSQPTDPCKIILKRADRRLLALVNTANASTLYFSKVNPTGAAADDWSAVSDAGSIAIDGAHSQPLTGGITFGSYDIIFKDYAAFKVWGYPAPQAVKMIGSPGCAAPYSTAQGEGLGFHLSHNGVYMYDGNRFILVSDPIKNIIKTINASYIQNSFGVYRDGYYWLFYTSSSSTVSNKCLIYDVLHSNPYQSKNIWFERNDLAMNCPAVFSGIGDGNKLYAGGSASTGFVYRLDYSSTGADDTANIEAVYQTKYFNSGLPNLVKRFTKISITYYSSKGDLLFNWYTNRGINSGNFSVGVSQTGVKLGTFTLGTDLLSSPVEVTHTEILPDNAVGKDISIKVTHDDVGDSPIIREIEIEWEGIYDN